MIQPIIKKWMVTLFILLIPSILYAAVPEWKIIPNESSITFTGVQNDAPASGDFKTFTGEIYLDPNQLNESKVHIVIDMNSISTAYSTFTTTLLTKDWLDVKQFPQAVFEANHFLSLGNNKYQANGTVTLRDKTLPITVTFTAMELSKNKGKVTGTTTLKRLAFGVGQGEWADISLVKDEVQVNFTITAVKS